MKGIRYLLILAGLMLVSCLPLQAEEEEGDAEANLPKSGVLSRSVKGGYQSKDVNVPWGTEESPAKETSPITGSVSKLSDKAWKMKLFNNSEESTYSADVRVNQYNLRGVKIKSDYFSYTLKPGESTERDVSASASTVDSQLELVSWKNLTPKKEKKDEQQEKKGAQTTARNPPVPVKK
ncbi:MAG: hypothetical protein DCC75_07015 [Proteobacteria bacterium]|nr:MAG: hypothetical protein DCC75_07015 [Pseudomonadota bacterium]